MSEVGNRDIPLNWEVFVTPGIPTVTSDLPPGTKQQMWCRYRRPSSTASGTPSSSMLSSRSSRKASWWIGSRRAART